MNQLGPAIDYTAPVHLTEADPLLILAAALIIGVAFGALARRFKLPAVTGQILAGVLIGQAGFRIFDHASITNLQPITHFALGLVAVSVGAHLNIRRLRNAGRRLFWLVLCESIFVPVFVFSSLVFIPGINWSVALLLGTIAISTAPATIVAIVKETRSRGVFVKTLVAAVALNNMTCIFLFELARLATHRWYGAEIALGGILSGALLHLGQAALTGIVVALIMTFITRIVRRREILTTAGFIAILLTVGVARYLGYSPLLACLFLGLAQANITRERDKVVDTIFANFEPAILVIFFTLAGMELSLEHAAQAGLLAAVFFAARLAGKLLAGGVAMSISGTTEKLRRNIGLALIPQAGVAVGLVLLLQDDVVLRREAGPVLDLVTAVILTAVVANEVVGPILTRLGLARSGETGNDRSRLIDFIHEENIVTELEALDMNQAIEKLVSLLVDSHHLDPNEKQPLLLSALEREAGTSTCLGGGLAVPHAVRHDGAKRLLGVMGLSRKGLPFDTPDGRPVHCVVLLASPEGQGARHLQVLATLARTVGSDAALQSRLFNSESPAHASEILHGDDATGFNYFLDEENVLNTPV